MGCNTSKSADLTDEDVQFLMKNTSYTEKEIRDWYKGFQVDCPDGKLSRDKFIEIYKVFFKGGNPEKFCQHVYRTFDEDGNGSSKSGTSWNLNKMLSKHFQFLQSTLKSFY